MRKGVSFTLTVVVIGLILLTTALTVIIGGTGTIQDFFQLQEEKVSQEECRFRLGKVRQGTLAYDEISDRCRDTVSDEEWENIKNSYIQQRTGDTADLLTGG